MATYDARISQGEDAEASSHGRIDISSKPSYQIALAARHLDLQRVRAGKLPRTDLNLSAHVDGSGAALADANASARLTPDGA